MKRKLVQFFLCMLRLLNRIAKIFSKIRVLGLFNFRIIGLLEKLVFFFTFLKYT